MRKILKVTSNVILALLFAGALITVMEILIYIM